MLLKGHHPAAFQLVRDQSRHCFPFSSLPFTFLPLRFNHSSTGSSSVRSFSPHPSFFPTLEHKYSGVRLQCKIYQGMAINFVLAPAVAVPPPFASLSRAPAQVQQEHLHAYCTQIHTQSMSTTMHHTARYR